MEHLNKTTMTDNRRTKVRSSDEIQVPALNVIGQGHLRNLFKWTHRENSAGGTLQVYNLKSSVLPGASFRLLLLLWKMLPVSGLWLIKLLLLCHTISPWSWPEFVLETRANLCTQLIKTINQGADSLAHWRQFPGKCKVFASILSMLLCHNNFSSMLPALSSLLRKSKYLLGGGISFKRFKTQLFEYISLTLS